MSKERAPRRPTIAELAQAAGVSPSTVDRVLTGRHPVRRDRAEHVLATAEAIGFRAAGALRDRVGPDRPPRTLGFVLHRDESALYRLLGEELARATRDCPSIRGTPRVEHLRDLTPAAVADRILKLGRAVDALAVVAPDHPRVTQAVDQLAGAGVPVFALISDLSAEGCAGYAGLDNRKVGRTAAWAVAHLCRAPGKVGIVVGSHRYRCQEAAEISFRSYFREHAPAFEILEPLASLEDAHYAHETALALLDRHRDLVGLFIDGGGQEGVLRALREDGSFARIVSVARDLTPDTHSGLIDGVVKLVLSHPRTALADRLVAAMAQAGGTAPTRQPRRQILVPMEVVTSENL